MKIRDGVELYEVEGQALDNAWIVRNREMLEGHMFDDMRANGFVPVLDISPGLTFEFNAEREIFDFKVSMYGYDMGEKAFDYLGIILNDGILISKDARRVALCDGEGF